MLIKKSERGGLKVGGGANKSSRGTEGPLKIPASWSSLEVGLTEMQRLR
ncbi:hypothetical protein PENANT_c111G04253 [Penicillium antarcticum]|uniref:Uncharacterized protein n=1 Tax=Penicillium antarcticum TaxID=416450 RepID=A0A1V6PKE8_9EURO|nr:hypothetical protein PENANT_c111G04253 [Penicillium antarcticum]